MTGEAPLAPLQVIAALKFRWWTRRLSVNERLRGQYDPMTATDGDDDCGALETRLPDLMMMTTMMSSRRVSGSTITSKRMVDNVGGCCSTQRGGDCSPGSGNVSCGP